MTKPSTSEAGQWHRLSFEFQNDNYEIDWDKVDRVGLSRYLGRHVTAYLVSSCGTDTTDDDESVRTMICRLKVVKSELVNDADITAFFEEQSGDEPPNHS